VTVSDDAAESAKEEGADPRTAALEQEVAELRAKVLAIPGDETRRRRVAMLLLVGGAVGGLSGVFAHSIFTIVCGIGWIFGGAAVASTLPKVGGDGPPEP
jgi:hypothetical protein